MSEMMVKRIQDRAKTTKSQLQRALMRLNLKQRLDITRRSRQSLYESVAVYADAQELYDFKSLAALRYNLEVKGVIGVKKVSIVFLRHGIFLETGAAPKTRNKKPIKHSPRTPKKWLSVVLPDEVEEYRKIIMEEYGAELAGNLKLVINGVFDSRKTNSI